MAMIYLIKGTVHKTPYMQSERTFEVLRLVEANSEAEAEEKFKKHWDDQTDPYAVYYHATVDDVSEMIT